MNEIILYIGLGIFIIGGVGLLISAFRTSIFWGIAVLLIAPVAIFYLIVHWENAKGPFKIQVFGCLIIAVFVYLDGENAPLASAISIPPSVNFSTPNVSTQRFRCDGRLHCSQMSSRAEAEFFTRNCPNTKMDGDRDGIPCENDSRF